MPRMGERYTSELSWREELGIEPLGGWPTKEQMVAMSDDQIIDGLIAHVEYRNSTTGPDAGWWKLYTDEFWRRVIAPRVGSERMDVSVARRFSKLLKHIDEIKRVVNRDQL